MIMMRITVIFIVNLFSLLAAAEEVYLEPSFFIQQQFTETPETKYFWLTKEHKLKLTEITGHKPSKLRIKYWVVGQKSAWILEEIGKEQLITTGISVENGKIQALQVLIYRESRGYEVRQNFFTEQYIGASLDKSLNLDQTIDGITGATLSVRALNTMAKSALYMHANAVTNEEQKTAAN